MWMRPVTTIDVRTFVRIPDSDPRRDQSFNAWLNGCDALDGRFASGAKYHETIGIVAAVLMTQRGLALEIETAHAILVHAAARCALSFGYTR